MYPILLDMRGRLVVVVGGGRVAARKVAELVSVGARIIVISPDVHPEIDALRGKIDIRESVYVSGIVATLAQEIHIPFMVFAATDSPEVNAQVVDEARSLNVLVNVVDATRSLDLAPSLIDGKSDFSNMAAIRRGEITIAITTGGASPALASHLREQIEGIVGEEYATLAHWMGESRSLVKGSLSPEARRAFWHSIIDSPVLELLSEGYETDARAIFDRMIEEATQE